VVVTIRRHHGPPPRTPARIIARRAAVAAPITLSHSGSETYRRSVLSPSLEITGPEDAIQIPQAFDLITR